MVPCMNIVRNNENRTVYVISYTAMNVGQSPQTKKGLGATEMCFYRRMLKIPWTEHESNEKVWSKIGFARKQTLTIR